MKHWSNNKKNGKRKHEKNTLKSEPVIFENPLIPQTSIWIKEELNEINDVQNDNSDFNNFVEVSEPNEDCQNSFENSEVGDPVNYVGLNEPKIVISIH